VKYVKLIMHLLHQSSKNITYDMTLKTANLHAALRSCENLISQLRFKCSI